MKNTIKARYESATANQQDAFLTLLDKCFDNMGGVLPSDLAYDMYTWCDASTLVASGRWTKPEAAGTYGWLIDSGLVQDHFDGDTLPLYEEDCHLFDNDYKEWSSNK